MSSEIVEGREERYQFTWPDKKKATLLANSPINATLRPCREESVDFDNTENLYIEGDNLDVLKCLKETYLGKVKMIYIDPPYNTGNDFIYEDDFAEKAAEYKAKSGQFDEQSNRLVSNSESNGRFHTDWLNMIYPRLKVARDLLSTNGLIFISIDDNEYENLKKICNEIYGSQNCCGVIIWKKKTNGNNVGIIPPVHDYILVYAKNINDLGDIGFANNNSSSYSNPDNDPRGPWTTMDLSANHKGPYFAITNPATGEVHYPSDGRYWVFNEGEVLRRIESGRIIFGKSGKAKPVQRVFLSERGLPKRKAESWWDKNGMNEDATSELTNLFGMAKIFSHPKPVKLLYDLCSIILEDNDIMLDFFSGSATSAHAVMELNMRTDGNRKFIEVQLPENIDDTLKTADTTSKAFAENSIAFLNSINKPHYITEIGKERIRRAGKLIKSDNLNNAKKELDYLIGQRPFVEPDFWCTLEELESKISEAEKKVQKLERLDVGFRVLKLDSSNMEDVYYAPSEYRQENLFAKTENVKPDRTAQDLLFQVMLELGATLDSKIEQSTIEGKALFNVADGYMVACFDNDINDAVVTAIAKMQPQYAVFRDSSMADDSTATNFEQIFKTYSPDTTTKVI